MEEKGVERDDRAVSPVIGIILIVGITVILMSTIGTYVFALSGDAGSEVPDFEIDCNTQTDVVKHGGGDEIEGDRLTLENPSYDSIDDSRTFTAGDELVPSSASIDVTLNSGIVWENPRGGSILVECGP